MAIITLNNNSISNITSLPTGVGGKVLQVQKTVSTTATYTTSSSFVSAGISVSITPSSTSNEIILIANGNMFDNQTANNQIGVTFYRTISGGSATNISSGFHGFQKNWNTGDRTQFPAVVTYIDAPNTTSATSYEIYFRTTGSQISMNKDGGTISFIAMEVAG